ncbi:EAL domain-containing protein [Vibrio lentus]|nr:EAL domain-containing protein [Vibrio lentus]
MKESTQPINYSINLNVTHLPISSILNGLEVSYLQLSALHRSLLAFEFPEGHLIAHLDYMRPVAKMLSGLGCTVIVGQAGRTIVSTHYIKDLKVNYIKLHRSLIKKIDQRRKESTVCSQLDWGVW